MLRISRLTSATGRAVIGLTGRLIPHRVVSRAQHADAPRTPRSQQTLRVSPAALRGRVHGGSCLIRVAQNPYSKQEHGHGDRGCVGSGPPLESAGRGDTRSPPVARSPRKDGGAEGERPMLVAGT